MRPVKPLGPIDRARIQSHLLALDADDSVLRFGHTVRDDGIARYVDGIDLDRDTAAGIETAQGELVAFAHVCIACSRADFGLSTLPTYRSRGLGVPTVAR